MTWESRGMSATAVFALALLFLANVENYGQRMILSILLPAIESEISLTDGQLGVLLGGGFGLCYALAGVPLARFADNAGRVKWLSIAVVLWSAATGLLGFTRTFIQMLLARILLGIGVSVCIPTAHSLLIDYVPDEHRPFALGLHSAGGVVAATICVVLGGYLAAHVGWRDTLWIIAASGVALGAVMIIVLREPARRASGNAASPEQGVVPLRDVVRHLAATRSYVLVLIACCFAMLIEFGSSQWLPSYYVRQFSLSVQDVGFRYGLALGCGGIPGSFLGGWVVSRLAVRDIRWLAWFPAAMYALALPTGLSMLMVTNANLAISLNGLYSFLIYTTSGAFWAALFIGVPSRMRATTSAVTLLIAGLTGLTLGPILTGGLSELWSSVSGPRSLQPALISIEALGVFVILPLLLAARHLAQPARTL